MQNLQSCYGLFHFNSGHVHIQVAMQNVKLTFSCEITYPALKTRSVAIKFAHSDENTHMNSVKGHPAVQVCIV